MLNDDTAIIIPARIGSQRLHRKLLRSIGDSTIIEWVVQAAFKTGLKNIFVATDSQDIASKLKDYPVRTIMTESTHSSGTDRIHEALSKIDNTEIKYVINLQGDMPFIDSNIILEVIKRLKSTSYEIITPITKIDPKTAKSQSNVKVVVDKFDRAIYFSRSLIPSSAKEFLYHIGIYGFTKLSLDKFVHTPPSSLEQTEKLEQLRAIENGMLIGVCYVDDIPISVDTQEDLDKAISFFNNK